MGKYMRKAKLTGDIGVMEVSQSSLGVQTRAKTLALQRLQTTTTLPSSESSYLQLRSRRLEKPPLLDAAKKNHHQESTQKENCTRNPNPDPSSNPTASSRLRPSSVNSGSVGSVLIFSEKKEHETEDNNDFEGSFGENNWEFEGIERSTRESTPCSFIRDSDTIGTPGSTTRPISSTTAGRRTRNTMRRIIPTTDEMDEFFASAEQEQLMLFTEKYNFDFVNELPLPGRYEWCRD
ncbi:cyclin-dependent kinase inhibitor 3-like isoform X2 [Cornus florida]|uniref:cyclin-dependent kinase inhibitor 3-like isoform X2 n=1 Tax=Cornus florida TaxID=4283 RepID=UPI0028A19909|nr:cyclin-dependent kinase inhibitor 3-like isoform X2 [Cornus florida]XP_059626167.1 cyclin-dependent kinase inhibitor 3-like isoform X2 [Cornus florida]